MFLANPIPDLVHPWLPPTPHTVLLAGVLNRVLKPLLDMGSLQPVAGMTVCIRVSDTRLAFWLSVDQGQFRPRRWTATPDVTIAASAGDFWRLLQREEDPDTLFFRRRLVMEGNTEAALLIKNVLASC